MIEFVEEMKATERPLDSVGVIDAGCGSGILALSAVALGLALVEGFDLDPESVRISDQNAELNGLSGRVRFCEGDLRTGLRGRTADLVLANILADVLMAEREILVEAVAPGGRLVLSGILASERDEVWRCFQSVAPDFAITSRMMGEWADLQLVCPG
jgi:ribosomal protein L11 methyltransferase